MLRNRKVAWVGKKRFIKVMSYPLVFFLAMSSIYAPFYFNIDELRIFFTNPKVLVGLTLSIHYLIGVMAMLGLYFYQESKLNQFDRKSVKMIISSIIVLCLFATTYSIVKTKGSNPQKDAVPLRI